MNTIYKILFFLSRSVTLFIFGMGLFTILNSKYMLSENFFPNIFKIIKSSAWLGYIFFAAVIPKSESIYQSIMLFSQFIDIVFILIIINLFIFYVVHKFWRYKYFKAGIIFFFIALVIFTSVYFAQFIDFFVMLLIIPIFYIAFIFLDRIMPFKKYIAVIPVIGDFIVTKYIISCFFNEKDIELQKKIIVLISIVCSSFIFIWFKYESLMHTDNLLLQKNTYAICVNPVDKTIVAKQHLENGITVINDKSDIIKYRMNIGRFSQSLVFNRLKNEYYLYDVESGILYVLDGLNFQIIKQKQIINVTKIAYERMVFIEDKNVIIIVFEDTYNAYSIDADTLNIVHSYKTYTPNDGICYNPLRETCMLTSWQIWEFVQELFLDKDEVSKIHIPSEQGYISFSKKNKEIYIAFHQMGIIGVYDAESMELKRKISVAYSVKGITYDEDLNLLIAPSYFTGYVYIFLMDGTDRLVSKQFVGYLLREAKLSQDKKCLYVSSPKGLYAIKMDVQNILENLK